MAANYWASTQRLYWQYTRAELQDIRADLDNEDPSITQQYPLPDIRLLSIFFNAQLGKLGKRMSVRQQALATAQIYVRRFYIKVDIRSTNPYLILATALYLACKMEETPQHIRLVVDAARNLWPDFIPSDVAKLGECEFYLISEMSSQLIVHHPYRTLQQLQNRLSLGQEDISFAWSVINDHYLTDLPLLVAPHVVAITAISLALTLNPNSSSSQTTPITNGAATNSSFASKETLQGGTNIINMPQKRVENLVKWLSESEVDIQAVIDSSQEMISLYDIWGDSYNEKTCKEQIARFVKARGLDK
ncbi:MAG: hypothetical protein Q9220_007417 [cf. Caloplaca sp. 1 TL-2023]